MRLPFFRKKRWVLYLARRGEPLTIAEFTARSEREAREKAMSAIEDLDPEQIQDLQRYRSFRLCSEDAESLADCVRIRNPYFRKEEKEEENIMKNINEIALASVAQTIPKIVSASVDLAMQTQAQITQRIINTLLNTLGVGGEEEKPIDKLLKIGEQLLQLWQAQNQAQAQKPKTRPRILEGYK